MRIVVGLGGDADEQTVEAFAEAGAGEFFVGYVPDEWSRRYGFEASPNRRHRPFSQLRTAEALGRVLAAARDHGLPVSVTLNEHQVVAEQLPLAEHIVETALSLGATGVILAELALAPRLAERFPGVLLAASGEAPVYSRAAVRLAARLGFGRIILARETSLADMALMVPVGAALGLEFEAFLLGEWCVYNGALCLTCHGYGAEHDFCSSHGIRSLLDVQDRTAGLDRPKRERAASPERQALTSPMRAHAGGCSLCALAALQRLGVASVKIPGRSQGALSAVRKVRALLDGGDLSAAACRAAIGDPAFCDGRNCWHRRPNGEA